MIFVTFTCPFWQMVFFPEGIFFRVIKRWANGVQCKQTSLMLINVCKAIFIRRSTARSKTTKKSQVNWMCAACLYHLSRLHDHLSRLHRSWNNSNTNYYIWSKHMDFSPIVKTIHNRNTIHPVMQISSDVIGLKKSLSQAHKYQRGLNLFLCTSMHNVTT